MSNGVMPLQWEGKCLVRELFVALSFSFAFAFALVCSFSKTFDGSFLGALIGAFFGSFLGTFGNFPLPLFFPRCAVAGDRKAYLYRYPCEYLVGLQWRL